MRPVRFVALSEDGQAFVLADEVGRLLALPARRAGRRGDASPTTAPSAMPAIARLPDPAGALSPRDIQARIRAGESADEVARIAGVPVDRVLRYAGPVLQERAMLAQHARRTKLKGQDKNATLAQVVDARLAQHGVDAEKISWDAYRREDGTWRIVATWPSGKATATAMWELDKARQLVTAHDDMAQYLSVDRPSPVLRRADRAPRSRSARRRAASRAVATWLRGSSGDRAAVTSRCARRRHRAPGDPAGPWPRRRIRSAPAATRCWPGWSGDGQEAAAKTRRPGPAARRWRASTATPTLRWRSRRCRRWPCCARAAPTSAEAAETADGRREAAQARPQLGRRAVRLGSGRSREQLSLTPTAAYGSGHAERLRRSVRRSRQGLRGREPCHHEADPGSEADRARACSTSAAAPAGTCDLRDDSDVEGASRPAMRALAAPRLPGVACTTGTAGRSARAAATTR